MSLKRSPWDHPPDRSLSENRGPSYSTALPEGCPGGWVVGSRRNDSCGDLLALKMSAEKNGEASKWAVTWHISPENLGIKRERLSSNKRERERQFIIAVEHLYVYYILSYICILILMML